jgi:hypothetical protein
MVLLMSLLVAIVAYLLCVLVGRGTGPVAFKPFDDLR